MKKIILPLILLGNLLYSQKVILEQPKAIPPADFISSYANQKGIFTADDFLLTEKSTLSKITIYGKGTPNFLTTLKGFSIHIIPEQDSKPIGIPFKTYTSDFYSISYPSSGLVITELGNNLYKVELNKLENHSLFQNKSAGKYWLSVNALVEENSNFFMQNNWFTSASGQSNWNEAVFVDPDNLLHSEYKDWTPISKNTAYINSLAFTIEVTDELGTHEIKNTPSFIINNDKFTLTITDFEENFNHCEIYDMTGKKIGVYNHKEINISHLNPAVYLLSITKKNGEKSNYKFRK